MIELHIPGRGVTQLDHLVCDVNGTLALDGRLLEAAAGLARLRDRLTLHLLTADTHGRQQAIDQALGVQAVRIPPGGEAQAKADYVRRLGADRVAAIGQGANDVGMLEAAALGIAVLSPEGLATTALSAADVLAPDLAAALALLEHPLRLVATLRQ